MVDVLNIGDPINGTSADDLILGNPSTTGTAANTLNGSGGDDAVIGDIGAINVLADTLHNGTLAGAFSLEANANTWTLDENPLVANSTTVAHSTTFVNASDGEWEYFAVSVGAGKTLTVDLDFGLSSAFGGGAPDAFIQIFDSGGNSVGGNDDGGAQGAGGSFHGLDPYATYTAPAAGTYYILVRPVAVGAYFAAGETFVLNVSVSGHGTGPTSATGADTIDGGDGYDALYGVAGNDIIAGGLGNDTIDGGSGDDTLSGGDGHDVLFSGTGTTDLVHGNAGNDTLRVGGSGSFLGDAGNDSVRVDAGGSSQALNGGDGIDTVDLSGLGSGIVTIDLAAGTSSVAGMSLIGFENATTGDGNDTIGGDAVNNVLSGGDGNDGLFGGTGSDTLLGGAGDDTLTGGTDPGNTDIDYASYADAQGGVTVSLAVAGAQNTGGAGMDTLTGIEGLIGGASGDNLIGNDSANWFRGGGGGDTIDGGGGDDTIFVRDIDYGADTIDGAAGTDTLDLSQSLLGWSINLLQGGSSTQIYSLNTGSEVTSLTSVERVVASNVSDLILSGGVTNPIAIYAGGGNDAVTVYLGAEVVDGGAGIDTVDIGLNSLDIGAALKGEYIGVATFTFDMATGVTSEAGESLVNFENVAFLDMSAFVPDPILTDFTILGTAGANDIVLGAGDDLINGRGGADTMTGGAGNDFYYVDAWGDVVTEAAGEGSDRVFASVSYVLGAAAHVEILSTTNNAGTAVINLTGNDFVNSIAGNNGANTLNGGAGADTLNGLGGDDLLYVDNAVDVIVEAASGGSDRVFASVSYALGAAAQVEILSTTNNAGVDAINLTGNGFANSIAGNAGANVLDGLGGSDTLNGLGGADTFRFTTALGAGNVDAITGYVVADDKIEIDNAVFTGLAAGALAAGAFRTGAAAADADDRIIYNSATGALLFDADGNGAGAAVQFATLSAGLAMAAGEFVVI